MKKKFKLFLIFFIWNIHLIAQNDTKEIKKEKSSPDQEEVREDKEKEKKIFLSLGGGITFDANKPLLIIPITFEWKVIKNFGLGTSFHYVNTVFERFGFLVQIRANGIAEVVNNLELLVGISINYINFTGETIQPNTWGWSIYVGIRYDFYRNLGIYSEGSFGTPSYVHGGLYYRF